MNITKKAVEKLQAPATGYALYRDDKLKGFGVRVTAAGVKTYFLERRVHGKVKRIKVGRVGEMTTEDARQQAKDIAAEIDKGKDPIAERRRRRAFSTTLDGALTDYVASNNRMKQSTADDMRYVLTKVSPGWMDKALVSVTRDEVKRRHAKTGARTPALANKWARYLRAVFNFAMNEYRDADGTPFIAANPAKLDKRSWFRVEPRKRFIKPHELRDWMPAVLRLAEVPEREAGQGRHRPKLRHGALSRDFFLLVLLTGLRRTEALNLTWRDVDLQARTIHVPETKAHRAHELPLSDYLVELFERRKEAGPSEYVFQDSQGRLTNVRVALDRVRTESGVYFTAHDLRRTFANVAESLDIPAYALKRLLNHATDNNDVTSGYLNVTTERLRKPMQRITDYMLTAGGLRESAEVVQLDPNAQPAG